MPNQAGGRDREAVFREVLGSLSGDLLLTASSVDDFAGLLAALGAERPDAVVRVLVDEDVARVVRGTFVLAARTAELVESGTVDVRVEETGPVSTLLLGSESVRGVAALSEDAITTLTADGDDEFVDTARDAYLDRWEAADVISLRTPGYSRILETLGEELGDPMREDVEAVFAHAVTTNVDVEPVDVCLLMGARNEVQFYELGLWGESEGVASRAKFSREKQRLEERGLITTEKIPADIGRPRQRLVLPEEHADLDPIELTSRALTE